MSEPTKITPAAMAAAVTGNIDATLAAMTEGGIEAQEKRGQQEQAEQETLPMELGPNTGSFEKAGFLLGEKLSDLFQEAIFPDGWYKKPTDHSLYTDILDGDGRRRGSIFFKDAFYDRSAKATLTRRFLVKTITDRDSNLVTAIIEDAAGMVERSVGGMERPRWGEGRELAETNDKIIKDAEEKLKAWLDTTFSPAWRTDVNAHWDD